MQPFTNVGKHKMHSCLALARFAATEDEIRAAVVTAVESLTGFQMAKTSYDTAAQLEIEFYTPARFLDIVSLQFAQIDEENCEVSIFSKSTSICPTSSPWRGCRPCCGCIQFFYDQSQNAKHVRDLVAELETVLGKSGNLDIQHES